MVIDGRWVRFIKIKSRNVRTTCSAFGSASVLVKHFFLFCEGLILVFCFTTRLLAVVSSFRLRHNGFVYELQQISFDFFTNYDILQLNQKRFSIASKPLLLKHVLSLLLNHCFLILSSNIVQIQKNGIEY